jgi:hypothetical protein
MCFFKHWMMCPIIWSESPCASVCQWASYSSRLSITLFLSGNYSLSLFERVYWLLACTGDLYLFFILWINPKSLIIGGDLVWSKEAEKSVTSANYFWSCTNTEEFIDPAIFYALFLGLLWELYKAFMVLFLSMRKQLAPFGEFVWEKPSSVID